MKMLFLPFFLIANAWTAEVASPVTPPAPTASETADAALPAAAPASSPVPAAPAVGVDRELFESGVENFAARKYSRAIERFQKLLAEHPSSSFKLQALFYLGQSYFQARKYAEAVEPLQSAIEIAGKNPLAQEARVVLGNAYLEQSKNSEAYLVSEELLRQPGLRSTLRGKALLIRAQAQAGMKRNLEAEKTFLIFQAVADQDPELEQELARSLLVSILVKANTCDQLPSAKKLPEAQLIDQMNRKGLCLLEMGAMLSKSSRVLGSDELKQSSDVILETYRSFEKHCSQPPLARGGRTAKQFAVAKKELAEKLKESCQSTFDLLMESLKERDSARVLRSDLQSSDSTSTSKPHP